MSDCGCSHSECNKTRKGVMCPKHGKKKCPTISEQLKPAKSPEKIAVKFKVPLSKVNAQVKAGTKIEGEHTTDKSIAKKIALQHVDERPDYYTKIKQLEKSPMKEDQDPCWKGYTQVGMKKKNGREVPNCVPSKGVPKAKGYKKESFFPEDHKEIASGRMKDEEGYMARVEFDQIERSINILRKIVKKPNQQIPAWVQSKITRAADFIDTAAEYMSSDEEVSEACWKGYTAKGMKKKGKRLVPNCVKEVTEQMMPPIDPEAHKKAQRQQKIYNKAKEGAGTERDWLKKTGPQLPLAKKKSETQVAHFEPEGEVIDEAPKVIYSVGQTYTIILNWKTQMINLKVFFPSQKMPTKQEVEAAVQKIYPGAIVYTYMPAIKDPTKPFLVASEETDVSCSMIGVNSFLEKRRKNYLLNIGVIGEAAAWTRSSGKNPKGGLNEKGRRSYERENPGSDLKAPSKKVGNRRRASFCARMKGLKKKLTSKKTARDPNSRVNKSLKAWNC